MKRYLQIIVHPSFFIILALASISLSFFASLLHWELDADFFAQKAFLLFALAVFINLVQVTFEMYPVLAKKFLLMQSRVVKILIKTCKKIYE